MCLRYAEDHVLYIISYYFLLEPLHLHYLADNDGALMSTNIPHWPWQKNMFSCALKVH